MLSVRFVLSLTIFSVLSSAAMADEDTTRYFEQLRRRGLFRLAEGICYRGLSSQDATSQQRSQWTRELSRTLAEHARYKPLEHQQKYWTQARAVIDTYLKANPQAPDRALLQLQKAVVLVVEGEYRRWDAELYPYDASFRLQSEQKLQQALTELETLETQLAGSSEKATTRSRGLLTRHIRYQRAIALVNLAELHPAGSAARKSLCERAAKLTAQLAGGPETAVITLNSKLLQAVVNRLQGNYTRAADQLKAIEKRQPTPGFDNHLNAEALRILLENDRVAQANILLSRLEKQQGVLSGELSYLKVKILAARWDEAQKAGKPLEAKLFLKQAEADVAAVEHNVGGYWAYRCRVLFDYLKEAREYGPELTAALRKARSYLHGNETEKAITAYAAAAQVAENTGKKAKAVELRFTHATLLMQESRFEDAAAAFQQIAAKYSGNARAPEADLMHAYCLGRYYDARKTKSRRLAYTQALQEHRRRFPESTTASEAAWMLAALYEYRGEIAKALEMYLAIPADHARGPAAQLEAARAYEQIIGRLRKNNAKELPAWERHAAAQLSIFIAGFKPAPAVLDRRQTEIALRAARIGLNQKSPNYKSADAYLDRVLTAAGHALQQSLKKEDRVWWTGVQNTGRQLKIVSLAGTRNFEAARLLIDMLAEAGTAEVLAVLDGLMQLDAAKNAEIRSELGNLQLRTALKLQQQRDKLSATEQRWLDRCLAQAYSHTNQPEEAAKKYEKLLEKSPDNKPLIKAAASLLINSQTRDGLLKAKSYWRKLESLEKTGSPEWLNARFHVALANYRMTEYAECKKLITLTKLLYPQLGGGDLKKRFEDLLRRTNRELSR